ncbi:expressed unknown protein [Seminavis robusta]|uniref:Prolyl 4-hydroxylase alpha subunit domain-containing protein n=1 Tax=Seminavis robusta TaxID=568900 RepID=A0A9N8HVK3_9STRA|nr:expressed unknown protein [Seminavis robusta]|eukprot:Sro2000_g310230.1 n/a (419) ;mRNA; r:9415-10671
MLKTVRCFALPRVAFLCSSTLFDCRSGVYALAEAPSNNACFNSLDVPALKKAIGSGHVYQHHDFLSNEEVNHLWNEINRLEETGVFARSGLSNTVQANNQNFGNQDRTLCPVPWWTDSLQQAPAVSGDNPIQPIASRIQDLRHALGSLLDRPTMTDASLAHECYYSMSQVGSFLPRHMDERHEELKGAKGWLLPSRRSLSWLIYLSDPEDWTLEENGGALRAFVPKHVLDTELQQLTQDEGNLQIGWLLPTKEDANEPQIPVYLDSWFPVSFSPEDQPPEPHCILYTRNPQQKERVFLTQPWLTEGLQGISLADFLKTWAQRQSNDDKEEASGNTGLFLRGEDANNFVLIEDRPAWDAGGSEPDGTVAEDVLPSRGSLVIFDSVTVPHQVELIKRGRRVALAGWFHEETQPFPEGLYS